MQLALLEAEASKKQAVGSQPGAEGPTAPVPPVGGELEATVDVEAYVWFYFFTVRFLMVLLQVRSVFGIRPRGRWVSRSCMFGYTAAYGIGSLTGNPGT